MDILSLFELNGLVRETIECAMDGSYWVEAELSELRERGGHCYMELVQKEPNNHTPIAKASAKCWRTTWSLLQPRFQRVTGEKMRAGMKLLLRVSPQFHEQFGFSWIVSDIDPNYTMGDLARRRKEIIIKLREEGVIDLNKELTLPLFTQRIAVVSSESAAGYGDFCDQLLNNQQGFYFHVELFPAIMQGELIEKTIVAALNEINNRADDFDCVVIIRGGGATSDMSGFDTLLLAENVANFPLPVITGIGHERDECVIDLVAHTQMKTPTAVAAFLVDRLSRIADRIDDFEATIVGSVRQLIKIETMRLQRLSVALPHVFSALKIGNGAVLDNLFQRLTVNMNMKLREEKAKLDTQKQRVLPAIRQILENERHRLDFLTKRIEMSDPDLLLRRGYSITTRNGAVVTSQSQLSEGDTIETRFADGTVRSVVSHEEK